MTTLAEYMISDMGGYQPWQAGTTGSMTAYNPSWRDSLAGMLIGDSKPSPDQSRFAEGMTGSRGFGITQPGVLDATPAGLAFAGNEAYREPNADTIGAMFIGPVGARNLGKAGRPTASKVLDLTAKLEAEGLPYDQIRARANALIEAEDPKQLGGWTKLPGGHHAVEIPDNTFALNPRAADALAQKNPDASKIQEAIRLIRSAPQKFDNRQGSAILDQIERKLAAPQMTDAFSNVATHDMLTTAYPSIGRMPTSIGIGPEPSGVFSYPSGTRSNPELASMPMARARDFAGRSIEASGLTQRDVESVLLHEAGGHGAANIEGWPTGGSANDLFYFENSGENIANAIMKRRDLDAAGLRANDVNAPGPYGYQVPVSDQVQYYGPRGKQQMSAPSPAGIRGYHGSPHDFPAERLVRYPDGRTEYVVGAPDQLPPIPQGAYVVKDFPMGRFREDKAFTGEGAQAYGHGAAYIAEKEGVARRYRDNLTRGPYDSIKIGDNVYTENVFGDKDPVGRHAFQLLKDAKGDAKYAKEVAGFVRPDYREAAKKVLDDWEKQGIERAGRMYEVWINADPEHFLDWDKLLSQQSEKVRQSFSNGVVPKSAKEDDLLMQELFGADAGHAALGLFEKSKGSQAYNTFASQVGGHDSATKRLRDAGIPGIKYLDQGSRDVPLEFASKAEAEAAGYRNGGHDIAPGRYAPYDAGGMYVSDPKGTRNYVVFDDKIIDILKKYGIAGTAVAGGGMAVSSSDVEAHPALIPLLMGTIGLPMYDALTNMPRDADRAELMLQRQSPRLYDYAPQPGMLLDDPNGLAKALAGHNVETMR